MFRSTLIISAAIAVALSASSAAFAKPPNGNKGFVIFDHPEHGDIARADLAQWLRAGRLNYLEDVLLGIESAPDAIAGLYRGENLGKRLIRLDD